MPTTKLDINPPADNPRSSLAEPVLVSLSLLGDAVTCAGFSGMMVVYTGNVWVYVIGSQVVLVPILVGTQYVVMVG